MQTDVIPICRICLQTLVEYVDMESSFYSDPTKVDEDVDSTSTNYMDSENLKKLTYMDCFKECTRLNEKINCHVPQGICIPCSLDLRFAFEFLKKAENAAQFYENYAKKKYNEFQEMQMINDELSCSSLTMEETVIKSEEFIESEIENAYERNEALSETEEFPIPTTQSHEDDIIDTLELKHLTSDENTLFEVISIDNERNKSIEQLNEHENSQEEWISTINEDTTSNLNAEKPKRMRKTNKLHGNKNVNSSGPLNICKICNKNLDKFDLTGHMEEFHMYIEKCDHCEYEDKEFKVREHEKLKHPDKHLCYICSKTYTTLSLLNGHLKYHERKESNPKSEACKICGKTFVNKNYLRRHLEVHKNERQLYKCEHCDNFYGAKSTLNNHMKMHKGETIKCLECNKQFLNPTVLKVHMRFHTHEYPFNCEVCGKKFAIKGHLRTHMWRHQGLKLQCEDCGKLFISSKALVDHSYKHTGMPFPCSYCPKGYPSKQKFKVHLKTAHSNQLNEEELRKVTESITKKPYSRKKLKLVQADTVLKGVKAKTKDQETEDIEDLILELL